MAHPLKPEPNLITIFTSDLFVQFCNDLIRAEANRIGLPPNLIDDTVREKAPDGGIDCRISSPEKPPSQDFGNWFPAGGSGWQYKSGKCPSANALLSKEFSKPEVLKTIRDGHTYCFLTADSITGKKADEIRNKFISFFKKRKYKDPKIRVYNAKLLSEWAIEHPAFLVQYFRIPLSGWQTFEQWEGSFRNDFFPDPERLHLIQEIRRRVDTHDKLTLILGAAGVGKTRTVLEALRPSGFYQRVLYFDDAARLSPEFFWYLQQNASKSTPILVIDECTAEQYQRLKTLVPNVALGTSTIAIGPMEFDASRESFQLGNLSTDRLAKIVESFSPALSEPERNAIASKCGGSPKLVVFVAQAIAEGRGNINSWKDLEQSVDLVFFINTRLFPFKDPDPAAKVMRAISLFSRLGWDDELANEAKIAFNFFRIDEQDCRLIVGRLLRMGIVSRRGRYLYPTPEILANYLTRTTVEVLGTEKLLILFKSLPENAKLSMADRLRHVGEDPITKGTVSALLKDSPFFFSKEMGLTDPSILHLFRKLAPINPKLALQRLYEVIDNLPREEISRIRGNCRRELVWMLEELVWWEDDFEIAAKLLLRLAWGENETYGNSATEIWARLFQVILGGTGAAFETRFPVLKQALDNADRIIRRLGLRGLNSALQTSDFHRFGGPPQDLGKIPPPEWRPSTYGEWGKIIYWCLAELEKLIEDRDASIRDAAISVLKERGPDLIYKGFAKEWIRLARKLSENSFELREKILEVTALLIPADSGIDEGVRAELKELDGVLAGDSFSDRMRRIVGKWHYELEIANLEYTKHFEMLALEGLENLGQLRTEFPWLFGGKAHGAFLFGKAVGKIDSKLILLDILTEYWTPHLQDDSFFSGYLAGVTDQLGIDWLEEWLDACSQDPTKSLLAGLITWRVINTERSARRLQKLLESGVLSASFLQTLIGGFWARGLSPKVVSDLVTATINDKSQEAILARIAFLNQYIRNYPNAAGKMNDLLESTLMEGLSLKFKGMAGHHWKSLAEHTFKNQPQKMFKLCMTAALIIDERKETIPDEIGESIRNLIPEASPEDRASVFREVIGPAFEKRPSLIWTLEDPFKKQSFLEQFDPADIVNWIEGDVEKRLPLIANVVPFGESDLSGLARALLIRWGDRKDVSSGIGARLGTGIWWGPESQRLYQKLRQLEKLSQDPHPNVRQWAVKFANSYRKQIERARILEEEENHS